MSEKKRGRPRQGPEKVDEIVATSVSATHYQELVAESKARNMSLAALVRSLLNLHRVKPTHADVARALDKATQK